jgi:ABC-type transport system involved in multi-copper enzyme maturation permease subunit
VTWLTWRQFRTQALVAGAGLAALAVALVVLGFQLRHAYAVDTAGCGARGGCGSALAEFQSRYQMVVYLLDALLLAIPGITGVFWGAPLVARELEAGTHRLVWNQSITRRRWLAVKLAGVGLASTAASGLVSLLLTWAASPYDRVATDRFDALVFGARNVAPVAYAAFGFVLGTVLGMLLRRTVPAMALTILLFVLVQVAVPTLLRPHLEAPVTRTQPMTAAAFRNLTFLGAHGEVGGLHVPDAWVISTSSLLAADGRPVNLAAYNACISGSPDRTSRCLAALDLHVRVQYQPGSRYWTFQWLESALFLAAGTALAGLGLWRIRRHN